MLAWWGGRPWEQWVSQEKPVGTHWRTPLLPPPAPGVSGSDRPDASQWTWWAPPAHLPDLRQRLYWSTRFGCSSLGLDLSQMSLLFLLFIAVWFLFVVCWLAVYCALAHLDWLLVLFLSLQEKLTTAPYLPSEFWPTAIVWKTLIFFRHAALYKLSEKSESSY
jgi:hypothetical protein